MAMVPTMQPSTAHAPSKNNVNSNADARLILTRANVTLGPRARACIVGPRAQFGCNQRYHAQAPVGHVPLTRLKNEQPSVVKHLQDKHRLESLTVVYTNEAVLDAIHAIGKQLSACTYRCRR